MKQIDIKLGKEVITLHESDGRGQTALLISGNCCSSESFSPQLNGKLGKRFRMIAIDLPGHGKSPPAVDPEKIYSLPGYASIVIEVFKQLELDAPVLVGHSLGGHVFLEASPNLPNAKGCFIFGTPPVGIPPAIESAFLPHPARAFLMKVNLTHKEAEIWSSALTLEKSETRNWFLNALMDTDPKTREFLGKSIIRAQLKDEIEIVSRLQWPLAVIHAAHDQMISLDYITKLYMPTLWRGSVQIIQNASHFPQRDVSEEFDTLLTAFMESLA